MLRLENGQIDTGRATALRGGTPTGEAGGLSQDYLAHLQHMVSLIERAIADPSLRMDVLAWRPQPYRAFFARRDGADAAGVLRRYECLDPIIRRAFEALVAGFDRLAADAAEALAERAEPARELAATLRIMQILLDRAAVLVDDGDTLAAEAASARVARLSAR